MTAVLGSTPELDAEGEGVDLLHAQPEKALAKIVSTPQLLRERVDKNHNHWKRCRHSRRRSQNSC